jgi:CDP-paratose 2-epimerase
MSGHRLNQRPVLITGGCGFVGSNLANALAERGHRVIALDNLGREGARENAHWLKDRHGDGVEIGRGDVRDFDMVCSLTAQASAVLHLAGQVAVTSSLQTPAEDFEINARGTLNVLEAVRTRNPGAPVVFASTNKVYGKVLDQHQVTRDRLRYVPNDASYATGVAERQALDFHSPYGCSKGAADQYVRDYARVFGLRTAVMRMSCIYGPRQFGTEDQGWIAHFFLQALRGKEITIYGDGFQVRDALHINDAVAAWLAVLARVRPGQGEIFNLGGGPDNSVSLRELLGFMSEMDRHPCELSFQDWRPGDQPWYVSNTIRLAEKTGWVPRVPLQQGLKSLDAWLTARFAARPRASSLAEVRP